MPNLSVQNLKEKYIQQLNAFKEKLLNISTKNKCVFLCKLYKKHSLDLVSVERLIPDEIIKCLAKGSGQISLLSKNKTEQEKESLQGSIQHLFRTHHDLYEESGL